MNKSIDFGRGMIFPSSYDRDEFSRDEELRQDEEQRRAEEETFEDAAAWDLDPQRDLRHEEVRRLVRADDFR